MSWAEIPRVPVVMVLTEPVMQWLCWRAGLRCAGLCRLPALRSSSDGHKKLVALLDCLWLSPLYLERGLAVSMVIVMDALTCKPCLASSDIGHNSGGASCVKSC